MSRMTAEEKKLNQAILRGAQMLVDHGLGDWKIEIHGKRRVLADTNNHYKRIRYSKYFLRVTDKSTFDGVTLHEIAHALIGAEHGHDATFKRKVREISPNNPFDGRAIPEEVAKNTMVAKYIITCPDCGTTGGRNRARPSICLKCMNDGKKVLFNIELNPLILREWS